MKTNLNRLLTIVTITTLISVIGIQLVSVSAQAPVVNITPFNTIFTRGTESGQLVTNVGTTSTFFAAVANQRHYIKQATCHNASATALALTIYDSGANAANPVTGTNTASNPMFTVPCPTSVTTGAYDVPITFDPPLETGNGDAISVGVGTAANAVTISLNGFKGVR